MLKIFVFSFILLLHSVLAVPPQKNVPPNGRIIGGNDTNILQHPHQATVEYLDVPKCGGTIIARTWILTAAHCLLTGVTVSGITVRVGTSYYGIGGQVIKAKEVIRHVNYSTPILHDYDIAVIQLEQPIFLTRSAQIIGLPNNGNGIVEGRTGTVTGWGITTNVGADPSTVLKVIHIPIISQSVCHDLFNTPEVMITDRMFCAGLWDGGKDSCSGDGGGPLVSNSVLTGIVSWGIYCAEPHRPGVYTNVGALRNWITDVTGI